MILEKNIFLKPLNKYKRISDKVSQITEFFIKDHLNGQTVK